MSKTAQRRLAFMQQRRAMWEDGFFDGREGRYFMWRRHPLIKQYRAGYRAGTKSAKASMLKSFTFWQTLKFIFGLGRA